MNSNHVMTVGAIAFAGYAVWSTTRKAGNAVAAQPAQRAKDQALIAWQDIQASQAADLAAGDTFFKGRAGSYAPLFGSGIGAVSIPDWYDQAALNAYIAGG
jgi:hypothetical protein